MIKILANLFRLLSFIFGVTAPPPEEDQRRFVFTWLVIILIFVVFCVALFYGISRVRLA